MIYKDLVCPCCGSSGRKIADSNKSIGDKNQLIDINILCLKCDATEVISYMFDGCTMARAAFVLRKRSGL